MSYATLSQNLFYSVISGLMCHRKGYFSVTLPYVDLGRSESSIPLELPVKIVDSSVALASNTLPRFFIDARPEEQFLVTELIQCLDEHHKKYLPPVDFSSGRYGEILEQLQDKLLRCDRVILILGNNTPISWLRNHLKFYKKVQIQRTSPLYVTVYNRSKRHLPDLDFPNLSTCYTSQDCVE